MNHTCQQGISAPTVLWTVTFSAVACRVACGEASSLRFHPSRPQYVRSDYLNWQKMLLFCKRFCWQMVGFRQLICIRLNQPRMGSNCCFQRNTTGIYCDFLPADCNHRISVESSSAENPCGKLPAITITSTSKIS